MIGTYERLRVHVNASNLELLRAARLKIAKKYRRSRAMRDQRHKFFRAMIEEHKRARRLFVDVVSGNIGNTTRKRRR